MALIKRLSDSRIEVIRTLLDNPDKEWTLPELEKISKQPHSTVWRMIGDLEEYGIIKSWLTGERKLFKLVRDSPYLKHLQGIIAFRIAPLREAAKEFADQLSKLTHVDACILFGSLARGTAKPNSDIDILILVSKLEENLKKRILQISAELSSKKGCTFAPDILEIRSFREKLKLNDPFAVAVKRDGIILHGEAPW